ncbi:MAG: serine-tRNA(Ala) deacylase AlaX [Candidatus Caldatribacteriota bacterium]
MTERIYYQDSYLKEYKSKVIKKMEIKNRPALVLDQTIFYPTSGGQPYDQGFIQNIPVVEVLEEGEDIIHVLQQEWEGQEQEEVISKIDWTRRFDHMQQHTGQHILSGALMKIWGIETVSFHLGEKYCTLDINKADLTSEEIKNIEFNANKIIFENKPVESYFIEQQEELKRLNLRKEVKRKGKIRIVEVKDFDISACGGTHCRTSGEIGLIKITRWERKGENIRLEFICGQRAWKDYFWKNEMIKDISTKLTVKDAELAEAIDRLLEERREIKKELREYKEKWQEYEISQILGEFPPREDGIRVIKRIFKEKKFPEVRDLIQRMVNLEEKVIIFGGMIDNGGKIIFACSKNLNYDMKRLVKEAEKFIEGRGGGSINFAQSGGKKAEGIAQAIDFAVRNWENFVKS